MKKKKHECRGKTTDLKLVEKERKKKQLSEREVLEPNALQSQVVREQEPFLPFGEDVYTLHM